MGVLLRPFPTIISITSGILLLVLLFSFPSPNNTTTVAAAFSLVPPPPTLLVPLHSKKATTSTTTATRMAASPSSSVAASALGADDCLKICAIQPTLRRDDQSPQEAIAHVVQLMKEAHTTGKTIDLFVLPELCPIGYSEHTFANFLPDTLEKQQAIYEYLDQQMAVTADELQTHICYGTIGWHTNTAKASSGGLDFTIRQKVVGPSSSSSESQVLATYDKMYPCDFGDCSETRFFIPSPTQQPVSFGLKSFRIGIIICADQRVPTLCRSLAKPPHNVDVILQPAAFYRDVSFPSWKSFRETRAIENSVYFMGVNYAGDDWGETTLVPPWVDLTNVPLSLNCQEGYLIGEIQRSTLQQVRTEFPFHKILQQEED